MTIRLSSLLIFATFLVVVVIATVAEPHYPGLGSLIWPGAGISFLICLVLHVKYFDHALLITCMDVLFNTLLYWGIFTGAAAIYRRARKKPSQAL
jgi:hypothetical protein